MAPISIQHLRQQLFDKIPVSNYTKCVLNTQQADIRICEDDANLREEEIRCNEKLTYSPKAILSSSTMNNDVLPENVRIQENVDNEMWTNSQNLVNDLSRKKDCAPLRKNEHSKVDGYDFTRVRSTYTSHVRRKLARNEPITSQYYEEHLERFGKPPFIWEMRNHKQ